VRIQSQAEDKAPGATLGRSTLAKTFRGALEGTGRGELAGISGSLAIDIRDGKHYYTLRYQLVEGPR
jgi:hypothetical protein